MSHYTYFGSQCTILKSKLIFVTNMSQSNRISCTEGGGNAIANPTIPIKVGSVFLFCVNEYCGRRRHKINTTRYPEDLK